MPSKEQISISKLRLDIAKERLSYADEILIVVCNEYNKLKNFCLGWSFDPGPPHQRGITPPDKETPPIPIGTDGVFYAANGISIWFLTALSDNSCDCICSSEKSLSRSSSRRFSTCS